MPYFVIKTVNTKNLNSIYITVFSFQNCWDMITSLLITTDIVARLFWQFWIIDNELVKNLNRKFFFNHLSAPNFVLAQKIPIMYGELNTTILWISHHGILHLDIFIPLLGEFGRKYQICLFAMKFGTWTSLSMLALMVMITFSVLDWKYLFWAI